MSEEHRLEPNGGFKMVVAVIAAVHLLGLVGFLMLSLHPLKRMDQEQVDQELVWINPGSFGGNILEKTGDAPAVSAAPSAAPPLPAVENDEPPPDAAAETAPAEPDDVPASMPATPVPVEPVPAPEMPLPDTPAPLPPLPAPASGLSLATPSPPRATPAPTPRPAPKPRPKPSPNATPRTKPTPSATPKPKASPSPTPKARSTPKPSAKPKPSPKPAPERSPETAPSPKSPAGARAGAIAKNGDKTPRTGRVDNSGDGTAGPAGATAEGSGTGNGESKLAYYAELIKNRFQAAWNQPHGEISAGTQLVATVRLRIQPDGTVTEFNLVEGSGNSVVDESVREAGRKITRLPPPPGGNIFNPVVRFELGD